MKLAEVEIKDVHHLFCTFYNRPFCELSGFFKNILYLKIWHWQRW